MMLPEKIDIIFGKYKSFDNIEVLNSKDTLKLILDPNDILIPSKHKFNTPDSGFDIALIGLSRANKLKVDSYILHKN